MIMLYGAYGFTMIILTSANISSREIIRRFEKQQSDLDINILLHLSRDEYISHLQNHKSANKKLLADAFTQ